MDFTKLYKETKTFLVLNNDINNKMISHTYLLISNDIEYIKNIALECCKHIFCLNNNSPCNSCINCEKTNHQNNCDISIYPKDNKQVLVDDINYIINENYIKPTEMPYKIFIINSFENLRTDVQNKLLKTLEEPSGSSIFIITTSNEFGVLPTILSRAKKIYEHQIDKNNLLEYIKSNYPNAKNNYEKIIDIANCNLTKCISLLNDKNILEIDNLVYDILSNMNKSSEVLKYSSKLSKIKDDIIIFFEQFQNAINKIIKSKTTNNLELQQLANKYNINVLKQFDKLTLLAFDKLKWNSNFNAVIDSFLMSLLEVRYKWA